MQFKNEQMVKNCPITNGTHAKLSIEKLCRERSKKPTAAAPPPEGWRARENGCYDTSRFLHYN